MDAAQIAREHGCTVLADRFVSSQFGLQRRVTRALKAEGWSFGFYRIDFRGRYDASAAPQRGWMCS